MLQSGRDTLCRDILTIPCQARPLLFGRKFLAHSSDLCSSCLIIRCSSYLHLLTFVVVNCTLWLNDRQPVKVLKSLNDRQSDIFLKFKESKEYIQLKLWLSIKNSQAIEKSCLDRESNAWFTLGSESESMVFWVDCRSRF